MSPKRSVLKHFSTVAIFGSILLFAPNVWSTQTHTLGANRFAHFPTQYIEARTRQVLTQLEIRPHLETVPRSVDVSANKNSWLEAVYAQGLVDTSWSTKMMADKRIMAEVIQKEFGASASDYYPKTLGLREFLFNRHFVDQSGEITATGEMIDEALQDEFPAGFVVRPAVGVAPKETGRGLFADPDLFIAELLRPGNALYNAKQWRQPVQSHFLQTTASGEAIVLQEDIVLAADAHKRLKKRFANEIRIHSYENHVVIGGVPSRWVQKDLLTTDQTHRAEIFANEFLQKFPIEIVRHQAWGIDVAVLDNGDMKISDIVTNRGLPVAWSSYLEEPHVLEAYTRQFEKSCAVDFTGLSGELLRHGWANYIPYWEKKIEVAKPGLDKILAYVPPAP